MPFSYFMHRTWACTTVIASKIANILYIGIYHTNPAVGRFSHFATNRSVISDNSFKVPLGQEWNTLVVKSGFDASVGHYHSPSVAEQLSRAIVSAPDSASAAVFSVQTHDVDQTQRRVASTPTSPRPGG